MSSLEERYKDHRIMFDERKVGMSSFSCGVVLWCTNDICFLARRLLPAGRILDVSRTRSYIYIYPCCSSPNALVKVHRRCGSLLSRQGTVGFRKQRPSICLPFKEVIAVSSSTFRIFGSCTDSLNFKLCDLGTQRPNSPNRLLPPAPPSPWRLASVSIQLMRNSLFFMSSTLWILVSSWASCLSKASNVGSELT